MQPGMKKPPVIKPWPWWIWAAIAFVAIGGTYALVTRKPSESRYDQYTREEMERTNARIEKLKRDLAKEKGRTQGF